MRIIFLINQLCLCFMVDGIKPPTGLEHVGLLNEVIIIMNCPIYKHCKFILEISAPEDGSVDLIVNH